MLLKFVLCFILSIYILPSSFTQEEFDISNFDRSSAMNYCVENLDQDFYYLNLDDQESLLNNISSLNNLYDLDTMEYRFYSLMSYHKKHYDTDLALAYGKKAYEGAKEFGDVKWQFNSATDIAIGYFERDDPAKSIEYIELASELVRKEKKFDYLPSILDLRAQVHGKFDNFSLGLFREAYSYVKDNDTRERGFIMLKYGECFLRMDEPQLDSAIYYLSKSREELLQKGIQSDTFSIELVEAYYSANQMSKATQLLNDITPQASQLNSGFFLLPFHYMSAKLALENNDISKAKESVDLFVDKLSKSLFISERIKNYTNEMKSISIRLDNEKSYYKLDSLYSIISDSIKRANEKYNVTLVESQLELNGKDEIIQSQKKIATFRLYILVTLATLLFALLALFYMYYKNQKAKSKIIESKQQLKESKANLSEANHLKKSAEEQVENLQKEKIAYQERELSTHILFNIKKNELLDDITKDLNQIKDEHLSSEAMLSINNIKKKVHSNLETEKQWDSFFTHFENVHPSFYKKLKSEYLSISQSDLRLLGYIKMQMSTKEIAQMTGVNHTSVNTARYRLKKKLELDKDITLEQFVLGV